MANGRYCDKHGEWAPDGQCRWCEPVQELEHAANCQPCMAAQTAQVPVTPPAPDCYAGIDRSTTRDETALQLWASGLKPVKGADIQQMMNEAWVELLRRDGEAADRAAAAAQAEAMPGYDLLPVTYVEPSNIQKLLDRNNKFAEIGRALYDEWRAGQVFFGSLPGPHKIKDLCEKLAASEAKQPTTVCEHPIADRVYTAYNGTVCGRCGLVL